ncbi:hypothetical protein [Nocardioides sp.]|uniref:hypothetical protein n=1 Tax=Nocardioides sp. TaxID=35761 RepID=UPI001A23A751|nr:hypothetical protein [Nocardioides sp.]MBJ7358599.1 hypothetical protein [Nocardioides sp.]
MRLASGTVLGGAAAISSPALWASLHGELPVDIALTRYLVSVIIVWAALSTLVAMVGDAPRPAVQEVRPTSPPEDEPHGDEPLV